jgi:hypothetical protein
VDREGEEERRSVEVAVGGLTIYGSLLREDLPHSSGIVA